MKIKKVPILLLLLFSLITVEAIYPQQSKNGRPQSSGNKKNFKIYQSHNSKISKPSDVITHKRKDFSINRNKITDDNTRRNRRNYSLNRNVSETNGSENYFHIDKSGESLWDGKHWDIDEYPLEVYIKESSSRYYKSVYKDYVSYAFKVWQKADNRIQFTFTNNSRNADIQFIFVENLGKKYEENYLGLTDYEISNDKEIEKSKVQISLLKFGNEKVSAGEIKATIIHELGHVFGLGHSENENDIMYPYIRSDHSPRMTYDELSHGDKEAVKDIIDMGDQEKYVRK